MTRRISTLICTALLVLTATILKAQSGNEVDPKIGFDPYGAFQSSKVDHVNILNGNVVVKIPLFTLAQRGAFKPITFSLVDNVMPWTVSSLLDSSGQGSYYIHATGGNNGPDGVLIKPDVMPDYGADVSTISFSNGTPDLQQSIQWSIKDYSGATHTAVYNYSDPSELRTLDGSQYRLKFQDFTYGGHTYSEPNFYSHNYDVGYNYDGSYYPSQDLYDVLPDVYDSNGIRTIRAAVGSWVEVIGYRDQDGNTMTVSGTGATGTDTIGRTMRTGSGTLTTNTDVGSHCPNFGIYDQPAYGYAVVSLVDTYGTSTGDPKFTYTLCYAQIGYHTNFWGSGGVSSPPGEDTLGYFEADSSTSLNDHNPVNGIQSIVLPDGTYWGFVYDNVTSSKPIATGMLTKIITPEGGAISYCYGSSYPFSTDPTEPSSASLPLLTRRWEQATAGTNKDACSAPTGTYWSYQIYPWAGFANTSTTPSKMIDPAGNETDYTYGVGGETSETTYIGCASGTTDAECASGVSGAGTVLKATTTGYDDRAMPIPYGDSSYKQQYSSYPTSTSTTLNGSVVGNTVTGYQGDFIGTSWECDVTGAGYPLPPSACVRPPGSTGTHYLVGQPYSTNTFQGSGSGTLLKSVGTTMKATGSGSYWDNNLLNLPALVTTTDGAGNHLITSYTYDDPGSDAGSGIGHLTSTTVGSSSTTSTSYQTWNANGMLAGSTDAKGNSTSYSYDGTGLYLNTITHPDTEADSYIFNDTNGLVTQHTDSNGNITRLGYDAMRRPWTIQYQDAYNVSSSAQSQVACYPSATQVKVYQAQGSENLTSSLSGSSAPLSGIAGNADSSACSSSSNAIMTTANVDGLGRVISKIVRAPEGDIETDTRYDFMGRAYAATVPYAAGGSPSAWMVTSAYDALSRPLSIYQGSSSVTSPSGDRKQWNYAGLSTTAIDENGNQTKTTNDFIDRIVEVDEPLSTGSSPTTATTTYSYNVYGLTGVTQSGVSGRSFSYDVMGRLYQTTNPETGTITYGYTNGGSLCAGDPSLPCSKTDARGIAVGYAYDSMNRLISKTYGGSDDTSTATLSSCYQYGTSSSSPANGKGRLINEWTKAGACPSSPPGGEMTLHSILAYDVMGRVKQEQQCNKTLCNIYTPAVTYKYDLAGKISSYSSGFEGFYFSNEYDQAGRPVTLTSSWNDPDHPSLLWSSKGYSFAGLVGADIGQHLDLARTYDSRSRVSSHTINKH